MAKRGLLLINLGSPDAPTRSAVHSYLTQFLTDRYVIDLPAPVRQVLVRAVIAPLRAQKSADAYAKIWDEKGSPLVEFTRAFVADVTSRLPQYEVRWAMRYGSPSIPSVLKDWNPDGLDIVPLYPQYAESSTRTALEEAEKALKHYRGERRVLQDFFTEAEYIDAEASQIRRTAEAFKPDHLLLSFHGLPEHHMTKLHPVHCLQSAGCCDQVTDANRLCYRAQCFATARAVQRKLDFAPKDFTVSFQSRLGRRPWIKPYTDFVISDIAAAGKKRLLVACPSFVADCLETLEEIQMRLREQFISIGGQDLKLVPSLNAETIWTEGFTRMIQRRDLQWR